MKSLFSRILGIAILIAIFFIVAQILITAVNIALNMAYIAALGVVLVALLLWYLFSGRNRTNSHV